MFGSPSQKVEHEYEAAYEFHCAMIAFKKWLRNSCEQQIREKETQAPQDGKLFLDKEGRMADILNKLSLTELEILKLSTVRYDKTRGLTVNFSLPSEFGYKAWMHEFVNRAMDKVILVVQEMADQYTKRRMVEPDRVTTEKYKERAQTESQIISRVLNQSRNAPKEEVTEGNDKQDS